MAKKPAPKMPMKGAMPQSHGKMSPKEHEKAMAKEPMHEPMMGGKMAAPYTKGKKK